MFTLHPRVCAVEVRCDEGALLSAGDQLLLEGPYFPMTRLRREGERILRTDGWPVPADIGRVVLLSGGEAGVIKAWWNAPDGSEWRWRVEFYNRR